MDVYSGILPYFVFGDIEANGASAPFGKEFQMIPALLFQVTLSKCYTNEM